MPENETLGQRIRRLRKKLGLSQEELAEKVNVHAVTVSKWETEEQTPKTLILKRLAAALKVSEEELLNGAPEQDGWVLHVEIGNTKEDFLNMKNGIKPESVIITSSEGGYLKLGGNYQL